MLSISLRVLTPTDKHMLYRHYQELDNESKECRFGNRISDDTLKNFIDHLNLDRDIHFAVVSNLDILALAQVSKYSREFENRLELGISVATHSRRKGYASLLWDCATMHATACNMRDIYVLHSPCNLAMATFCRKKGLRIDNACDERVGIWTNPLWKPAPNSHQTTPLEMWPGTLPQPIPLEYSESTSP